MNETTWIIDAATGELTVEGLPQSELLQLTGDLLPKGRSVNCARPISVMPIGKANISIGDDSPTLRVFRIYHNSVIEGPGRRSVLQVAGCLIRCEGFIYSLEWANYDLAHERHKQRTTPAHLFLLV